VPAGLSSATSSWILMSTALDCINWSGMMLVVWLLPSRSIDFRPGPGPGPWPWTSRACRNKTIVQYHRAMVGFLRCLVGLLLVVFWLFISLELADRLHHCCCCCILSNRKRLVELFCIFNSQPWKLKTLGNFTKLNCSFVENSKWPCCWKLSFFFSFFYQIKTWNWFDLIRVSASRE
jgi:hypothetical protein